MPIIFDQVTGRVEEPTPLEGSSENQESPLSETAIRQKLAAIARTQQKRTARTEAD